MPSSETAERGGGGFFLTFFKNIYLSHLNVWSCSAFLFLQSCNSLHTTQAWFCELYMRWPFMPGSHIGLFRLQCVCSPCVVRKRCRSSTDCFHTGVCNWSVAVYHKHNIYPLFWFQIQTLSLKMLFQQCDYFFLHRTVIQSFIDGFKHNKYIIVKQHIIQCLLLLHVLLDLYIKLLKWQNIYPRFHRQGLNLVLD